MQYNGKFALITILISIMLSILSLDAFSIELKVISDLEFPTTASADSEQFVTVNSADGGAALFEATGQPNSLLWVKVQQGRATVWKDRDKILIEDFTYGGSLIQIGKWALGFFDSMGELTDMRVGATARVRGAQPSGYYSGTLQLTISIVH
jgi:hypothetical protein